jgi:Copper type II ascorbate-dependent monooxygenase, N-terminal domain
VTHRRRTTAGALLLAAALALTGCSSTDSDASSKAPDQPSHAGHAGHDGVTAAPIQGKPLRAGERLVRMQMAEPYTPSAPYGKGTDDYRCFVLDPHVDKDAFITGLNILPGQKKVVHHVILFQVPPDKVAAVEAKDRSEKGEGWTCFGGTGVETNEALDNAGWLGAWAPGGGEQVMANDVGVPLQKGSRVIMQVHYNLLAGTEPDVSSAQLRLAPSSKHLVPLRTMLLPAPVELPCRPAHDQGPLCDRRASVQDTQKRFGSDVGLAADYLHMLCGKVRPGPVQSCDREVHEPVTIRAAAGHMHLLGSSISIKVNPGTPREHTVLDIPVWDFDNQGAKPVKPVHLQRGDNVRVTCRHDQSIRDKLPAFDGTQEKYVVWGEGTTDEMCLGLLLVTRS